MTPYTHPDYPAFREAMRREPAELTHKLVCADFLEEHGDAKRARFVRAMCDGAKLPAIAPSRDLRQWFKLNGNGQTAEPRRSNHTTGTLCYLDSSLTGPVIHALIRGGFVHAVDAPMLFLKHFLDDLIEREPVAEVVVNWVNAMPFDHTDYRATTDRYEYTVAGKVITVDGETSRQTMNASLPNRPCRPIAADYCELLFPLRWPGVKFKVNA